MPRQDLGRQIQDAIGKPLGDILSQSLPDVQFHQRFDRHISLGGYGFERGECFCRHGECDRRGWARSETQFCGKFSLSRSVDTTSNNRWATE